MISLQKPIRRYSRLYLLSFAFLPGCFRLIRWDISDRFARTLCCMVPTPLAQWNAKIGRRVAHATRWSCFRSWFKIESHTWKPGVEERNDPSINWQFLPTCGRFIYGRNEVGFWDFLRFLISEICYLTHSSHTYPTLCKMNWDRVMLGTYLIWLG